MTVAMPYRTRWELPASAEGTGWGRPFKPGGFGSLFSDWVSQPPAVTRLAPATQIHAQELLRWTGLSHRGLADILGVTHPTIRTLVTGEATELSRKPEVRLGLEDLNALCARLNPLVDHDPARLRATVLAPADEGRSIAFLAAHGEAPRAYLAALRLLAPEPTSRFPKAVFPLIPGVANKALEDG